MSIKMENKKDINKPIHSGHRKRVINKFIEHGLDSFEEHEVLEMLLFFSVPRIDTNPLAHRLIEEFGSVQNVLSAEPQELKLVKGVGDNTAALISLFRNIRKYQNTQLIEKNIRFDATHEIGEFCVKYFSEHIDESAIMLSVDSKRRLKKVSVISTGTFSETAFYAEKIMKTALTVRAPLIVIAHNHPGGKLTPSTADKILTRQLYDLMDAVHIKLVDHIICNEKHFTSLRECGLFDKTWGEVR